MAASTGFAPASLGLKDRDPQLLDDKAVFCAGALRLIAIGRAAQSFVPA
jgi:hypothetical protein